MALPVILARLSNDGKKLWANNVNNTAPVVSDKIQYVEFGSRQSSPITDTSDITALSPVRRFGAAGSVSFLAGSGDDAKGILNVRCSDDAVASFWGAQEMGVYAGGSVDAGGGTLVARASRILPTAPSVTLTVSSGVITAATVNTAGSGYSVPPTITVTDATGSGAVLVATLNNTGGVASIAVTNGGTGYGTNPSLVVAQDPVYAYEKLAGSPFNFSFDAYFDNPDASAVVTWPSHISVEPKATESGYGIVRVNTETEANDPSLWPNLDPAVVPSLKNLPPPQNYGYYNSLPANNVGRDGDIAKIVGSGGEGANLFSSGKPIRMWSSEENDSGMAYDPSDNTYVIAVTNRAYAGNPTDVYKFDATTLLEVPNKRVTLGNQPNVYSLVVTPDYYIMLDNLNSIARTAVYIYRKSDGQRITNPLNLWGGINSIEALAYDNESDRLYIIQDIYNARYLAKADIVSETLTTPLYTNAATLSNFNMEGAAAHNNKIYLLSNHSNGRRVAVRNSNGGLDTELDYDLHASNLQPTGIAYNTVTDNIAVLQIDGAPQPAIIWLEIIGGVRHGSEYQRVNGIWTLKYQPNA